MVALKIYPKHILNNPDKMRNVKREIYLLKCLDHPNIINLHYAINEPSNVIS